MAWKFFEKHCGITIERAFDTDGNPTNLYRVEEGEETSLDEARGQAYALSIMAQPKAPEPEQEKTEIRMR